MSYFHGTPVELPPGSLIEPGYPPANSGTGGSGYVWFSDEEDLADFWGESAADGGDYFLYEVEPTGEFEPDHGIATRQVLPGNFQSRFPLRIIREVA